MNIGGEMIEEIVVRSLATRWNELRPAQIGATLARGYDLDPKILPAFEALVIFPCRLGNSSNHEVSWCDMQDGCHYWRVDDQGLRQCPPPTDAVYEGLKGCGLPYGSTQVDTEEHEARLTRLQEQAWGSLAAIFFGVIEDRISVCELLDWQLTSRRPSIQRNWTARLEIKEDRVLFHDMSVSRTRPKRSEEEVKKAFHEVCMWLDREMGNLRTNLETREIHIVDSSDRTAHGKGLDSQYRWQHTFYSIWPWPPAVLTKGDAEWLVRASWSEPEYGEAPQDLHFPNRYLCIAWQRVEWTEISEGEIRIVWEELRRRGLQDVLETIFQRAGSDNV